MATTDADAEEGCTSKFDRISKKKEPKPGLLVIWLDALKSRRVEGKV